MMSDNLQKFLFLGVMMAVAISVYGVPGRSGAHTTVLSYPASTLKAEVPLLILPVPGLMSASSQSPSSSTAAASGIHRAFATIPGTTVENIPAAHAPSPRDNPPVIRAEAALVENFTTGEVYASQNSDKRWPLASLTKLMTAVIAMQKFNQNDVIPVTGTVSGGDIVSGIEGRYTMNDLLNVMLVASRNEVAEAFAASYGRVSFLAAMNEQAREWGMRDTHYDDPSGLSATNQTTIADLQKLVMHISTAYPGIWKITEQPKQTITDLNNGKTLTFDATNMFAGEPEFMGGKTGFTDEAQGNLISLFKYRELPVLVIVLGTDDRFGDTSKLYAWYKNVVQ